MVDPCVDIRWAIYMDGYNGKRRFDFSKQMEIHFNLGVSDKASETEPKTEDEIMELAYKWKI